MTGLHDIAVAILTALSTALGVHALPEPPDPAWRIDRSWEADGTGWVLQATSTAIPEACRADPGARVDFPRVVLGAHEIRLDGRLVVRFGDPRFARMRSFFGAPSLACTDVARARELEWSAWSSTRAFAHLPSFPRLTHAPPLGAFLTEILPLMAAGALLAGAPFCFMVFRGVAPPVIRLSLVAACLGFGSYCLLSVAGVAGLSLSVLGALRLGNVAVLASDVAIGNLLRVERLLSGAQFATYAGFAMVGVGLQAVAPSGDVAHLGTLITAPLRVAMLAIAYGLAGRRISKGGLSLAGALETAALALLVSIVAHDVLVIRGRLAGVPLGPIAMLGGVAFFAMAAHARITDTFRERDFLRERLEHEVARQTSQLSRRADELRASLDELRRTQAQLVHSEKMASLGILVAGVAHELNNPVSFIANNAEPLGVLTQEARGAAAAGDVASVGAALERIARVVDIMRRGAARTAAIVRDLGTFSRRGAGDPMAVDLHEGIEVTLRLLRARWAGRILVVRDFGPPLRLRGPCGELNQVWMNLLANACDAIAGTGHVWIRTAVEGDRIVIAVRDDGAGIAPADVPHVFDPFFSTKQPGKGTGLGLAVSHGVVSRLGGDIALETAPGAGTTMTVRLPVGLLATGDPVPEAGAAGASSSEGSAAG